MKNGLNKTSIEGDYLFSSPGPVRGFTVREVIGKYGLLKTEEYLGRELQNITAAIRKIECEDFEGREDLRPLREGLEKCKKVKKEIQEAMEAERINNLTGSDQELNFSDLDNLDGSDSTSPEHDDEFLKELDALCDEEQAQDSPVSVNQSDLDDLDELLDDVEPAAQLSVEVTEIQTIEVEPAQVADSPPPKTAVELIKRIAEIFQAIDIKKGYGAEVRNELRQIAEGLTSLNVCPHDRGYYIFTATDCRNNSGASQWENDKQTFDLQWCFVKHPGHKISEVKADGLFAGVFETPIFDWEVAYKIAVGKFTKPDNSKGHYTREVKIEGLRLSAQMMREHCYLFDAVVKRERKQAKDVARSNVAELDKIEAEAVKVRDILTAQNAKRKNDMNVDNYVNLWVALQRSGSNWSKNAQIRRAYVEITGELLTKSLAQRRLSILKKALEDETYTVLAKNVYS